MPPLANKEIPMSLERNLALDVSRPDIENFLLIRSLDELQADRKILNKQWWYSFIASGLGAVGVVVDVAALVFGLATRKDCDNKEEDCVSSSFKKQPLSTVLLTGAIFTAPCTVGVTFWSVKRHLQIRRELKSAENQIRQYNSPRPIL